MLFLNSTCERMITRYLVRMKNSVVLENNFLFLDLAEVIDNLIERISRSAERNYLMIVLSDKVMSVANRIARATGISDVLSFYRRNRLIDRILNEIQFDFDIVKKPGRDLPQDFILHEERNLKAKMISRYTDIYKEISAMHPSRAIILVDSLTSDGSEFRQRQDGVDENKMVDTDSDKRAVSNVAKQFVYLHLIQGDGDGINMIIEQR